MAKSTRQAVSSFERLYLHHLSPKSSPQLSNSHFQPTLARRSFSSKTPASQNGIFSQILSQNPKPSTSKTHFPPGVFLSRHLLSSKPTITSKISAGVGKTLVEKPITMAKSVAFRYREAVGLQAEAFWKNNYLIIVGAGGVFVCIALWRMMFGVASTFVGLSEGMAKYGFLALAAAMVSFAGMYARARISINPDKIYRIAMRKLNTSAAILEVMGAPLTGTDVRAYVISGGGPKLKNFKLKVGGKRCFLIFPIRGSERKGLVSVEVKKKKGQYDMRLLAVDVPMLSGPDQRIFLIGDEEEYKVGGGLIAELRDPIVKAMAAEKEFDDLDTKEEEEDKQREREEAERQHQEERERAIGADTRGRKGLGFREWTKRFGL